MRLNCVFSLSLQQNLSLLAKELLQVSGSGRSASLGQRFVQQVQGSPRVGVSSLNLYDKRPASIADVDALTPASEERRNIMDTCV